MTKPFSVTLKAGSRIYINGAVVRVDRRVSFEFLNDVTFLLDQHVLSESETTTPLRQLYYIVQTMLIEPANTAQAGRLFQTSYMLLLDVIETPSLKRGVERAGEMVAAGRLVDALKALRALFAIEKEVLFQRPSPAASTQPMETVLCK